MRRFHLIPAGLLLAALTLSLSPVQARQDPSGSADFIVFVRGQRVGNERVSVVQSADGWTIAASGSSSAPLSLSFDKFVAKYTPSWQPTLIDISAIMRGQPLTLTTTFKDGTASSLVVQNGQQSNLTHTVSPDAVSLPNNFYAAYEAVAMRLHARTVGDTFPVFVAPQAQITARIDRITPRRVETPTSVTQLRQFDVTFANPSGPLTVEVWVDAVGRLGRMSIPAAGLTVVRDDLATVLSRLDTFSHPRDQNVFIPANGFNLGATITPPADMSAKPAVVILLAGSGVQDRDATVFGIPVMGQIAARLSDAGFFVVRYDKRGTGQSGGRPESTSLEAYADDARSVVQWVRQRRDVDRERIALVGHSEGGAVALLTAGQIRGDIRAIGLLAAPGDTGRNITLAQQRYSLAQAKEPEASQWEKIDLQTRLMEAVATGRGWDAIPPELRRQADTLWFKSWLSFDPEVAMKRTRQPIFIAQGALDVQVPPALADRLEQLATARGLKNVPAAQKIVVPGVNHLLVPARTGDVSEYGALEDKNVSSAVTDPLIAWLRNVLPAKK